MSVFHSYEKVERLEKEECDGILNGICYIFEKLDGANAQIYLDTVTNEIAFGSRNRVLGIGDNLVSGDSFRGFAGWVKENKLSLSNFFTIYPDYILMGEWLIKHSLPYHASAYQNFYVFDVYNTVKERYVRFADGDDAYVWNTVQKAGLKTIKLDDALTNPTMEDLQRMLGIPSYFGAPFREGIVIKNYDFVNKWGRQPYGKLLHETFKEVKATPKAPAGEDAIERAVQVQYVTEARVNKICYKIKYLEVCKMPEFSADDNVSSAVEKYRLEMKHVPQVINMVWYDIITEDMNDILKRLKDPTINFKLLKRLVFERAKEYYIRSLQEGVLHEG